MASEPYTLQILYCTVPYALQHRFLAVEMHGRLVQGPAEPRSQNFVPLGLDHASNTE